MSGFKLCEIITTLNKKIIKTFKYCHLSKLANGLYAKNARTAAGEASSSAPSGGGTGKLNCPRDHIDILEISDGYMDIYITLGYTGCFLYALGIFTFNFLFFKKSPKTILGYCVDILGT